MIDEKTLRSFLVATPRATKILVKTEDDDTHEVKSPGARSGNSWAGVARSIIAMNPKLVELYDEANILIRATRCDEESPAVVRPQEVVAIHSDPETARLTHFANLLHRSYEFATGVAFTKMVELYTLHSERTIALESRLERAEANYRREMKERLDEAFERADDLAAEAERVAREGRPGDPLTEFAKAFMQGQQEQEPPPPPPNHSNGKARA